MKASALPVSLQRPPVHFRRVEEPGKVAQFPRTDSGAFSAPRKIWVSNPRSGSEVTRPMLRPRERISSLSPICEGSAIFHSSPSRLTAVHPSFSWSLPGNREKLLTTVCFSRCWRMAKPRGRDGPGERPTNSPGKPAGFPPTGNCGSKPDSRAPCAEGLWSADFPSPGPGPDSPPYPRAEAVPPSRGSVARGQKPGPPSAPGQRVPGVCLKRDRSGCEQDDGERPKPRLVEGRHEKGVLGKRDSEVRQLAR